MLCLAGKFVKQVFLLNILMKWGPVSISANCLLTVSMKLDSGLLIEIERHTGDLYMERLT